jgi:hypothetical protein
MLRKNDYFSPTPSPKSSNFTKHQRGKSHEYKDEVSSNMIDDSCVTFVQRTCLFSGNTDTVTSMHDKYSPFLRKTPESLMNSPIQSMTSSAKFRGLLKKKNTFNAYSNPSNSLIIEEDEMTNSINMTLPKKTIISIINRLREGNN